MCSFNLCCLILTFMVIYDISLLLVVCRYVIYKWIFTNICWIQSLANIYYSFHIYFWLINWQQNLFIYLVIFDFMKDLFFLHLKIRCIDLLILVCFIRHDKSILLLDLFLIIIDANFYREFLIMIKCICQCLFCDWVSWLKHLSSECSLWVILFTKAKFMFMWHDCVIHSYWYCNYN